MYKDKKNSTSIPKIYKKNKCGLCFYVEQVDVMVCYIFFLKMYPVLHFMSFNSVISMTFIIENQVYGNMII